MSIIARNRPRNVLLLIPVRLAGEKLPKSKMRMLCCDADGKVYAPIISQAVYDLARDSASRMELRHKTFATIGLETEPSKLLPVSVEISSREVWALEHILEHALKNGRLPDLLKKYLKPIIKLGESSLEAMTPIQDKHRPRSEREATPRVLNRLPYYTESDIEFSMPIYKAEYSYPLIVLKRLPQEETVQHNTRRLLILDADGDLAIIKVASRLASKNNDSNECMILVKSAEGLSTEFMPLSQLQKKALETLTKHFEKTGNGKQTISIATRTILERAKSRASVPV